VTTPASVAERAMDATYGEVAERGLGALTVEAVAVRAATSRATLYRHFPGGRDELVARTIDREVERFFVGVLGSAPDPGAPAVDHVGGVIAAADRLLGQHTLLQRLLVEEADAIVPSLATVHPLIAGALAAHLGSVLSAADQRGELRPGVDIAAAADHCARLVLSYVGSAGTWHLQDPAAVERLVRDRLLVGIVQSSA
jgi:AcrR family transcriptional regulator